MEAILIQQECKEVLKGEVNMSLSLMPVEKNNMIDRARSVIILCLGDKTLREVANERIFVGISTRLESLYMAKSLAHKRV
ncbi:hypothetical protein Fmac_029073 [Flemingia macrophylla]|uniref:Uncharacterized protein n=1 Tax=Flemingia macrophylla TaxID=520843 RepID=A0ABD1L9A9_9FABA